MKKVYEILYPFGCKEVEVEEAYETKFPYTEVVPDPNRELMLQFFDVKMSAWRPVEFMASGEKIALLENFYTKATSDVSTLDQQLTDTQLALSEVYEMLLPADNEVAQ